MSKTHPKYDLVIGLGRSGMSMARFLHHMGRRVVVTDMDASKTEAAKELNALGIKTEIGFHDQKTFNYAQTLVPSPGIPATNTYIRTALDGGVKLSSELDIFYEHNSLPVIAVTGTNGKTTVTTLIGEMLEACGMDVFVGGNIGTPLVEQLMRPQKTDIVVAEISSFQLDISRQFRPDVGVLLNISEDHMDRYDTFADYEASKWSLLARQKAKDSAVVNADMDGYDAMAQRLYSRVYSFSSQKDAIPACSAEILARTIDITFENFSHQVDTTGLKQLPGTHNRENIAAALLACLAAGADIQGIEKGLNAFIPLPHRISLVATIDKISFYNDSKATNTDAVIRALHCFKEDIILILGGRGKGTDFSLLIPAVSQKVKQIIAIGETRQKISETFDAVCPVTTATDMKDAVRSGFGKADKNDIVLLSPACASFDMYESYVHRGDDFIDQVNRLKGR